MRAFGNFKARQQHRMVHLTARATAVPRVSSTPSKMPQNQLELLQTMSTVVADTGDVTQIKEYKPVDCTTNPSLVLQAIDLPSYEPIIRKALEDEKAVPCDVQGKEHPYAGVVDRVAVGIGARLLELIPGRVSTECDARLAYNTEATIAKGRRLVALYKELGVPLDRLYIKIASTWEGILACQQLESEGISTNMTLLFDFGQAVACAQSKAALISPFVGRIMDWYKAKEGRDFEPTEDPGVIAVTRIFHYYKKYNIPTIVMAASFRNIGEIQQLAGCDNLTISPKLLGQLAEETEPMPLVLDSNASSSICDDELITNMDEKLFREMLAANPMATDKLTEGVTNFAKDQDKVEARIAERAAEWGLTIEC